MTTKERMILGLPITQEAQLAFFLDEKKLALRSLEERFNHHWGIVLDGHGIDEVKHNASAMAFLDAMRIVDSGAADKFLKTVKKRSQK